MNMIAHHRPFVPADTAELVRLTGHGSRARSLALREALGTLRRLFHGSRDNVRPLGVPRTS